MIDWSSCRAVEQAPDLVSGAWVFAGTRVPVAALFENLEDGVPMVVPSVVCVPMSPPPMMAMLRGLEVAERGS